VTASFSLSLQPDEQSDVASSDFLELRVAVTCRGFAGQTECTIAEIVELREARCDVAQLLGGWEEAQERLRLRITPAGRSGQFTARVRMADTGPRTDQWHSVETEFVCPPDDLFAFSIGVQGIIDRRAPGDAKLVGDAEAIA
jgi:hypothetical protein